VNTALVKRDLLDSLRADPEYRHAWNLENVYTGVCFQIRALREQRDWSQTALGKSAKMAPERISILEDPNADTKPTLNTLLRIANACDVGLDVRFVPYGTVIDRSTKTDLKALQVPSFTEELPELESSIALALAVTRYVDKKVLDLEAREQEPEAVATMPQGAYGLRTLTAADYMKSGNGVLGAYAESFSKKMSLQEMARFTHQKVTVSSIAMSEAGQLGAEQKIIPTATPPPISLEAQKLIDGILSNRIFEPSERTQRGKIVAWPSKGRRQRARRSMSPRRELAKGA
jgi:transcriptional regulator with XRE-family HTH domain